MNVEDSTQFIDTGKLRVGDFLISMEALSIHYQCKIPGIVIGICDADRGYNSFHVWPGDLEITVFGSHLQKIISRPTSTVKIVRRRVLS